MKKLLLALLVAFTGTAQAVDVNTYNTSDATTFAAKGTTTNDSAAAGYVGEFIEKAASGTCLTASIANITSQALTAGDWDVTYAVEVNSGAGNAFVTFGIQTANNTLTGTNGRDVSYTANGIAGGGGAAMFKRISIAATTTYYLNCQAPSANAGVEMYMTARRVR